MLVTNHCKVLYNIGEDIVLSINKDVDVVLNKTTVEAYLKTHSQLKKIWDTLGEDPVEILSATYSNVETKNVEVYLRNIRKYRALKDLASKQLAG